MQAELENMNQTPGESSEENDMNVSMNQSVCHNLFNNSTKRKSIVKYSRN